MDLKFDYIGTAKGNRFGVFMRLNINRKLGTTYVRKIIFQLLLNLRVTLGFKNSDENRYKVNRALDLIIDEFASKISLSGISHCFYLIGSAAPGFDGDWMGFEPAGICKCLRRYLSNQKQALLAEAEKEGQRQRMIEAKIAIDPKRRQSIRQLIEKLSGRKERAMAQLGSPNDRRGWNYKTLSKFCEAHNLNWGHVKVLLSDFWAKGYQEKSIELAYEVYVNLENENLLRTVNESPDKADKVAERIRAHMKEIIS